MKRTLGRGLLLCRALGESGEAKAKAQVVDWRGATILSIVGLCSVMKKYCLTKFMGKKLQ